MIDLLFGLLRAMPLSCLKGITRFAMLLVYVAVPSRRRIAEKNIEMAIGKDASKITLKTYLYFADMIAINIKYLGRKCFVERIKIRGMENFEKAKSLGRGVIFTTAHFGNWEMLVCAFAMKKEPINVMVRPLDNRNLDKLVNRVRSSCGNRIISSRESAFTFIRILKRGEPLGVLIDQAGGDGSFKVEFFGRKAKVSESIALFSRKLGVPILPAYLRDDTLEVIIEEPIIAPRTDDFEKDIANTMKKVYSRFEEWIRENPHKYLWMHNRWK